MLPGSDAGGIGEMFFQPGAIVPQAHSIQRRGRAWNRRHGSDGRRCNGSSDRPWRLGREIRRGQQRGFVLRRQRQDEEREGVEFGSAQIHRRHHAAGDDLRWILEVRNHPSDACDAPWASWSDRDRCPFAPHPDGSPCSLAYLKSPRPSSSSAVSRCQAASVARRGRGGRSGGAKRWGGSLRRFSGRRFGVVRRFLILRRGDDRGSGQTGPGDGREKHKCDRKCSFPQTDHRPAINERNQEEREHRHSRQYHAAHHFQRPLEELQHLEEE